MKQLLVPIFSLLLAAGCASPPHPYTIKRGGYLEEQNYAALQRQADKVKPLPFPKTWPNPSPMWSYQMETNLNLADFITIGVPELKAVNATEWKGQEGTLTNLVANAVAAALLQKKLFKEVNRTGNEEPLTLAGAVTFYQDGSVPHAVLLGGPKSMDFLQAEFKVMVHGKQVGVIQVQGIRGKNAIAVMAASVPSARLAMVSLRFSRGSRRTSQASPRTGRYSPVGS
jgi:hypothetical protein